MQRLPSLLQNPSEKRCRLWGQSPGFPPVTSDNEEDWESSPLTVHRKASRICCYRYCRRKGLKQAQGETGQLCRRTIHWRLLKSHELHSFMSGNSLSWKQLEAGKVIAEASCKFFPLFFPRHLTVIFIGENVLGHTDTWVQFPPLSRNQNRIFQHLTNQTASSLLIP